MKLEELYYKFASNSQDNLKKFNHISFEKNTFDQLTCLLEPKKNNLKNKSKQNYECVIKKNISRDINNLLEIISQDNKLIYAMIAPAFLGQFSNKITPGKLRSALKFLGFTGMVEVALFADILTLKEALEFDRKIKNKKDFMLTSCCCPMWIAMLRKKNLLAHVPKSVSPMIACGRAIKIIHKNALTCFIGPCVAKKSEAREKDLIGAVDFVLTFQEISCMLEILNINPEKMPEEHKEHSSRAGRIYARTGGVSEAVILTLKKINPDKKIIAKQANGILECKKLLDEIEHENINANFFEGMGCVGGCVGGPKKIIKKDLAEQLVNSYGDKANYITPVDNPNVIKLLKVLGFETIKDLLDDNKIFTRKL